MAVIEVHDIWKKYRVDYQRRMSLKESLLNLGRKKTDFWALQGISMDLQKGETLGIIGDNGSGKTTLLRIILGITRPTRGKIKVNGRMAGLLELGAGFHQDLTGRENIYLNGSVLGLKRREIDKHIDFIIDFADIGGFIDAPIRTYSAGMYFRLGFAIAVHVDPEILVIDEVLTVGDKAFQEKCLSKIKEFQIEDRTIVFVSHNLDMIRKLCEKIILMDNGSISCDGDSETVINKYSYFISQK
jgi:ABC-2 type transport system ATP-binding protein